MRIGSTSIDTSGLTVTERLRIIEEVWATLETDMSSLPVPDWHRRGIEARHDSYLKNGRTLSLDEVEASVTAAINRR